MQDSFEHYFLTTREETFFNDVQERIQRGTVAIKERKTLVQQHKNEIKRRRDLMQTLATRTMDKQKEELADAAAAGAGDASASVASLGTSMAPLITNPAHNQSAGNGEFELQVINVDDDANGGSGSSSNGGSGSGGSSALRRFSRGRKDSRAKRDGPMHAAPPPPPDDGDADMPSFADPGHIELVLRILQLMCEGQNVVLQDYLRDQPDNIKSVDIPAQTVSFLEVLYVSVDHTNVSLVSQVFQTLNEFASGNRANQMAIFDAGVLDAVNAVLRRPLEAFTGCSKAEVAECKQAAISVAFSMVEDNSSESRALGREMQTIL